MQRKLDDMRNIFFVMGFFFVLVGVFGVSYTWNHDHRKTETLEEYATLEFVSSRDEFGNLEGANLFLWDYRFDRAQLLNKVIIYIDGVPWEINAATRQTLSERQNENKLFFQFPKSSLRDMLAAKEFRLKFYYDNGQSIDLPVGKKELLSWQRKLRW